MKGTCWRRCKRSRCAAESQSRNARDCFKSRIEFPRSKERTWKLKERLNPEVGVESRARRIKINDEDLFWTKMSEATGEVCG